MAMVMAMAPDPRKSQRQDPSTSWMIPPAYEPTSRKVHSSLPHRDQEAHIQGHHEAEAGPRGAEAAEALDGQTEERRTDGDTERRYGEAQADGGARAPRPDELGHERVLDAVPADAEEAEGQGERREHPPAGAWSRPRHHQRAHRGADAGDDQHDAPPPTEETVGEHAEDHAPRHARDLGHHEVVPRLDQRETQHLGQVQDEEAHPH